MSTYEQFTEHNPWERRHWHYWLPTRGNRAELRRLRAYIENHPEEFPVYTWGKRELDENDVNILVEYSDTDTHPTHTKLEGALFLPPLLEELEPDHWFSGGRIRDLFHPFADMNLANLKDAP